MITPRTTLFLLLSLLPFIAQSGRGQDEPAASEETWTVVVYQDKPGRSDWQASIDSLLKTSVERKLPGIEVVPLGAVNDVSPQCYAALIHDLGLLSTDEPPNVRSYPQEWQFEFLGPPPQSISFPDLDFKVTRDNATFRVRPDANPVFTLENGQRRVLTRWQANCKSAPALPPDKFGHCSVKVQGAGITGDADICVSSRFNDEFLKRFSPRRLTLNFSDPTMRTKLLTAFETDHGTRNLGKVKEPTLFVPLSDVEGPSAAGAILVFVVESLEDHYFYRFTSSSKPDAEKQLSLLVSPNWQKCLPSSWQEYDQLRDKNKPIQEGASKDSTFQKVLVNRNDPKASVIMVGRDSKGVKIKISDYKAGDWTDFGPDSSDRFDLDWLARLYAEAQQQAQQ